MRVLMLSKACIVGIYQRKLEELARLPDIDLCVVVPPSWRDSQGETQLERAYTDGYRLEVTPIRFNGNYHLHYYPAFATHVAAFQPDIVHIDEEPYNLATWMALRPARRLGAKTLFFSWQNIRRNYPPPFNFMERAALRSVDHAIVGTDSAAAVWRDKGYTGPLAVIPQFGVDPSLFSPPANAAVAAESVRIGYAGRLWIGKGVDVLLKALAQLPDLDWTLKIIGSGPEEPDLKQLCYELQLGHRVSFNPWLPSTEMPRQMKQFDILVIPSRTRASWKEQYGRVIIEAMATGVTVIGSDSGAIPDVIGDAGLVFPEDNIGQLATQLRRVIEAPDLRRTLGQQARARVLEHFTQKQVAEKTHAVYSTLMDTPN
ncbi:MAG: glycosyltransferase family 4 protein [Chloroflexi bacterium]|nr:glycosyltransferase family 4 protein [Chloroflexota bacterium]